MEARAINRYAAVRGRRHRAFVYTLYKHVYASIADGRNDIPETWVLMHDQLSVREIIDDLRAALEKNGVTTTCMALDFNTPCRWRRLIQSLFYRDSCWLVFFYSVKVPESPPMYDKA